MRIEIAFTDFDRSDYIETYVKNRIEPLLKRLIFPDNDIHTIVRLAKTKERTALRRAIFQCELTVKSGMSSKTFKIVKEDRNLFRAITFCVDAAKMTLTKFHDRLRQGRRHRKYSRILTTNGPEIEAREPNYQAPLLEVNE